MTKVILLNGPRTCGKTVARDCVLDSLPLLTEGVSVKDHLHELTQRFFNISPERYWDIYEDRSVKEVPLEDFKVTTTAYNNLACILGEDTMSTSYSHRYLSIRQAMIYVSEVIVKPTFGPTYFSEIAASKMVRNITYIDESIAFDSELPPIIEKVGQDNILLIRIKGRGDFSGDSRRFISDGVVKNTVDIWNDGTEREYLQQIIPLMTRFVMNKF